VGGSKCGATAANVVVYTAPNGTTRVLAANCGDARTLLIRGGEAIDLSEEHVPDKYALTGPRGGGLWGGEAARRSCRIRAATDAPHGRAPTSPLPPAAPPLWDERAPFARITECRHHHHIPHSPSGPRESERKRIEAQNPNPKNPMVRYVGGTWRVGGLLALSRAFGDAYLKGEGLGRAGRRPGSSRAQALRVLW
jgi:hypothetical protein